MKNKLRLRALTPCKLGLILALASQSTLSAEVVFSESFESPVVDGFDDKTVPGNGNWVGATDGHGSTNRGLYNESVEWPNTPPFTTPYGDQAYYLNYTNSALTTAQGAISEVLTADTSYTVTFNAAVVEGDTSGNYTYRLELVAFDAEHDDTEREKVNSGNGVGTVLATASGTVTSTDMSKEVSITFTPDGEHPSLSKEIGLRLVKATGEVLYDNIRLIVGHDYDPSPADGEDLDAGGNVTLSWTNNPPEAPATETYVDILFSSVPDDPGSLTLEVDGEISTSTVVNAPAAGTYYWRIDSYPDGDPEGTPVSSKLYSFTIADTDGDGFPDDYESEHSGTGTGLNTGDDLDSDGLDNWQEYQYNTDPNVADTDGDNLTDGDEINGTAGNRPPTNPLEADTDDDGLSDGVESNSGTWGSSSDTGTDPTKPDTDEDGIIDGRETNTGVLVDRFNTGTDPHVADTDGDSVGDYYEVNASFTNPFDSTDRPIFNYPLSDPDATSDAISDGPVKVYIMAGQSNMVGIGYTNGINAPGSLDNITKFAHRFPNLVDASNNYTVRNDVYYRGVVTSIGDGPLTEGIQENNRVGVELGFGHIMGEYHDEPVLLLKASQGNRSLGWDFLPPGSTQYTIDGTTYAGYGESPQSWDVATPDPQKTWYAGKQYDECFRNEADMGRLESWEDNFDYTIEDRNKAGELLGYKGGYILKHNGEMYVSTLEDVHISDPSTEPGVGENWQANWEVFEIENAYDVLADFENQYQHIWGNRGYEIAGFVWWQGHKDGGEKGTDSSNPEVYATKYEENMSDLIDALRAEFNAPNAPFVVATVGFGGGGWAPGSSGDLIWNAQMAVGDPNQHPEYSGTVASVDTTPYWRGLDESPGSQGFHYNNNAETYTLVGDAMGRAMVNLLETDTPPFPNPMTFQIEPSAVDANTVGMVATAAEATTLSGEVEYYFEETSGNSEGNDSGWQSSTSYTDYGLTSGLTYSYRVKSRDTSNGLESEWSDAVAVTAQIDEAAPNPDPMSFETLPTTLGENSITMTATTALDINGPVEYFFECTNDAGQSSSWQTSATYTPTNLSDSTQYTFTVKARDSQGNETAASGSESATTDSPDTTPPDPDPMSFASQPTALGENSITMTATTAMDDSQVQYYFECTNEAEFSSGWQDDTTYVATGLTPGTEYTFRVRAQDKSPAQNTTANSEAASATTDAPDETAPTVNTFDPSDGSNGIPIDSDLVITFDEEVTIGTGLITIKNLTDGSQSTIDVADGSQISLNGSVLTINPTSNLLQSKDYAIQIAATVIDDLVDNSFAGISDDTTWNFTTEDPPPDGLVFSDDFETPAVAPGYNTANTSKQINSTKWVRSSEGYGGDRSGIVNEAENEPAFFTDPTGEQAWAGRYSSNTGVTTAYQQIGTLATGQTITVTFDAVIDGENGGSDIDAYLVVFDGDESTRRDQVQSAMNGTFGSLKRYTDTAGASYANFSFSYTVGDPVHDNNGDVGTGDGTTAWDTSLLGKDIALRFKHTDDAIIDNVEITITTNDSDTTPPTTSTLSPTDGATNVPIGANLVVTFDEDVAVASGLITLKNLTDSTASTIDIIDGTQISISGPTVTINPTSNLLKGKDYAVQIAGTAIEDTSGNAFAGISDDSTWSFRTVAPDFSEWISGYNVGNQNGPDQDADGDGLSNAAENYFGTDPSTYSAGLSAAQFNSGSEASFEFQHPMNNSPANDLTATYMWTSDLRNAFLSDGVEDDSGTTVTFDQGTPAGGVVNVTANITGTQTKQIFVTVDVSQDP
ncbi:Ig-like domain-containing protein [Coraliomargarita sinensis]|nr:Ig-like domain-containing protein [Coraliomargarita sinensis]